MYATGLSPAELRSLVASINWDTMFEAGAPYALKDFRRKEDARELPSHLELGLKKGLRGPGSLGGSEQIDLFLSRVTLRYYAIRTFDELPIPFRCVATDLIAEEPVVLADGSLAEALRATIAFPGLFSPVLRDGRMLADGGVLNNVPADAARAMGADIVIAVDVGASTSLEPGLDSALTVMSRTLDVLTDRNKLEALRSADILVKPDIKDVAAMDWRRFADIAERGYRAAASMPSLAALAVDDSTWSAHLAARNARRVTADPIPTSITVSGAPAQEQHAIRARLVRHLGHPLDAERIGADLTAVTGSARYDTVTYRLVPHPDGVELAVHAVPRSYGPPFLRFGLDLTNTTSTVLAFGIRGRLTAFDVAGHDSEMRLDAMIGTGFALGGELFEPIAGSRIFVAPRAGVQWSDQDVFYGSEQLADYRTNRAYAGADIGLSISRTSELRAGYTYGDASASVFTGDPELPHFAGPESIARLQFTYDGQNAVVVPSRGVWLRGTLTHIFQGMEPDRATTPPLDTGRRTMGEIVSSVAVPVLQRNRLIGSLSGGTSFGATTNSFYSFALGGPMRLRAYDLGEFRGVNYLLGSVTYFHNVGRLPDFIGGPIYATGGVESGSTFTELKAARFHTDLSAGLVLDTLLGPVGLTAAASLDGHFRVYVSVGRAFR